MTNPYEYVKYVEEVIYQYLPVESGFTKVLREAINYSVIGQGKRIRPLIMYLAYKMFGGDTEVVNSFMASIEMIHAYSLVHDDLPDMDNDTIRRGKDTTWYKYGADIGILTGDALLNLAFETSIDAFYSALPEERDKVFYANKILSRKAGLEGMIGGQAVDVISNGVNLDLEKLEFIHRNKTCALIEASIMIGGVLAGKKEYLDKLEAIGYYVGMAFQIQDDILDVIGNEDEIGKPVKSDEKNEKTTYVTLYGLDKAKELVKEYSEKAIDELRTFESNEYREALENLFVLLINRNK